MTDKTHYRKAFNSPYLSSADIVGPTVLNIARVTLEKDRTKKTKDEFNTAHFVEKELRPGEPLKPMILNATNCVVIRDMCGSKFIEDWSGPVTVYVDPNVRFGKETVEGLRLIAGSALITPDQAANLEALIEKVGADRPKFLRWLKVSSLSDLPADKYHGAVKALESKRGK